MQSASSQSEAILNASQGKVTGEQSEGGRKKLPEADVGEAAGPPVTQTPIQPTIRWFEPKKEKAVSQLLLCFLSSACQIPARFLVLLFLAPSFSSAPF